MRITDEQIQFFKKNGFLIVENFLSEEERKQAAEGFYDWYAPPYEQWLAAGKQNNRPKQMVFPWDHSGLNHVMAHPDLIDAAERIIGTREIRLCEAHLGVKYYGEEKPLGSAPGAFHIDYGNSTLGPIIEPDDFQHISAFYIFEDVKPGMAPILMVPNGSPDSEAIPMIAPGGSVGFYTPFTRHSASEFTVPGHRAAAWVEFSRKDRPWDGSRYFYYQQNGPGVKSNSNAIKRFIEEASPRQLELLGFPPPGDPLWTDSFLEGMVKRYKGFNPLPYRQANAMNQS